MTNFDNKLDSDCEHHCTLAVIRALTKPLLYPPPIDNDELKEALLSPWNICIPVDPDDFSTRSHWQDQKQTHMFNAMFNWDLHTHDPKEEKKSTTTTPTTSSLHPYLSFGSPTSPFFAPWGDVGNCLRHLLLNQIASHQTSKFISLTSHEMTLFIATASNFQESELRQEIGLKSTSLSYYLLRCHFDKQNKQLIFGYHSGAVQNANDSIDMDTESYYQQFQTFHKLHVISMTDDDWRLKTCLVLKNLARIINCLKDFAVPLIWQNSPKLSLVQLNDQKNNCSCCVQKVYETDNICSVFKASVTNMIQIYEALEKAKIPHTDRLVALETMQNGTRICKFAPIGRSYLPLNLKELLDALVCVCEALVAMHAIGIMHRDIRWANVFHAFSSDSHNTNSSEATFSQEWFLFDFEFAATAPQPAFAAHTLTPGNHAPEMVDTDDEHHSEKHDAAVDIWGLGYMIEHAFVDIPVSHSSDLQKLQMDTMQQDPKSRPTAVHCLDILRALQSRPSSTEKDTTEIHQAF
uniref:Protein kinase domain-containing protein n=1 Tax=Helicotheca tamesis TaxID=374047 RepID=A0A7S2IBB4_9STRA|mmetsp:Transcript_736/g.967  ORF Transcript_736/g.967 Transcript_736/m.967 type:complete len:520 (+) Transcript_736:173-1732(+)